MWRIERCYRIYGYCGLVVSDSEAPCQTRLISTRRHFHLPIFTTTCANTAIAMAHVVYARAEGDSDIKGDLFKDLKFFLAQRCPFRSTYVEKVTRNGGEVVKLEKHADILIADHAKAFDAPPGSISYKFIDESIRNGQLEDVENDEFRVGPRKGTSRPVGSIRPGKAGRTPFTPEDDRILWQWVADYKSKGGALSGLEIYKQLEATVRNVPPQ